MTFDFPWLSGDVPRLPSYGIYISQLLRFARCCTSVFDFHSKNLQITSKLLTQGYRYHKLRKTFGKFFRSYSKLLSKLEAISFQEYVSKWMTHPVFYGDLLYKLKRVKSGSNFILSGSKIVKRLRRRQFDPGFRSCWNIVSKLNLARSIFIIGSVWRWNWYCTHINFNNVILWGIIPICKIFAKTWHFLFCFGMCYSFWPFALTR